MYFELGPIYNDLPPRRERWMRLRLSCLQCAHEFVRIIPAGCDHAGEQCTFCGARGAIDTEDDDAYVNDAFTHH